MHIYLVGGAIRDRLLGLPVHERDWVVTGATPEEMRALGYLPLDGVFPVFRHPETGDEYALARVEVKRGSGHRGFSFHCGPDVTLEQDLARRDLTVNAIAEDENGAFIDPFGGLTALRERRLHHITPAFADDPLRLLRAARFAAHLAHLGFSIDASTMAIMKQMARAPDTATLSAARVWREMNFALRSSTPAVFFEVLYECGASETLMPSLPQQSIAPDAGPLRALKTAATLSDAPDVRLAVLAAACISQTPETDVRSIIAPLGAPRAVQRTIVRVAAITAALPRRQPLTAQDCLNVIEAGDGIRQPEEFRRVLPAICALFDENASGLVLHRTLLNAHVVATSVQKTDPSLGGLKGAEYGRALRELRLNAVSSALTNHARDEAVNRTSKQ